MKCPGCGIESDGRFCSSCGTPLRGQSHCASCGTKLAAGARFCTGCGEATDGRRSNLSVPWMVAGAAILTAIFIILLPVIRGDAPRPAPPFAGSTSATADAGQPPPLAGTPREQADRLFNRIMQEQSAGNIDQARFFTPMATQAYQAAEPLDADGLYHLSLIQAVAQDYPAAIATANRILDAAPTHLLGLAALAEAAAASGDSAAAVIAWTTFLDNLATERAKPLTEYTDHTPILSTYEEAARGMTGRQ
jgi:predicted nucleic acid-binding Zn ribbon protein